MKILIVGQGGREHAIAWKVAQSPLVSTVFCAPGNPGISECAELVSIAVEDIDGITEFALSNKIDLTIVGPEVPLSLGIVDRMRERGCLVFGPTKAAAQIEASKSFSKEIMRAAGVPTADNVLVHSRDQALAFFEKNSAPLVFKADGLAAGKGVFVALTEDDARTAIDSLYENDASAPVLIEQFLAGKEASLIVATDGKRIVPLAPSNDYKRIGDGDTGNNTGGMGTVSPTPNLTTAQFEEALARVIEPVLKVMEAKGTPFSGFLYAGLMISSAGDINCLEFNARLGDPETQVIMRRMESDFVPVLYQLAKADSTTPLNPLAWRDETAVCVVQAAAGYPGDVRKGDAISGIAEANKIDDVVVFHAGTTRDKSNQLVTGGGRVLNVTATGATLEVARERAYRAGKLITFAGQQYRSDIGLTRNNA